MYRAHTKIKQNKLCLLWQLVMINYVKLLKYRNKYECCLNQIICFKIILA